MTNQAILEAVQAGTMSVEDAKSQLAPVRPLYPKVSEKGALSVYGLQRMPVTLYVEQWDRLLNFADNLRAFIKTNASEFKRKAS